MAVPPFASNFPAGKAQWELSTNSGGSWTLNPPNPINEPANVAAGVVRYRRIYTVPSGLRGEYTVTIQGDIFDGDTNDPMQVYYDGARIGQAQPVNGPTTFRLPATSSGQHTLEFWHGSFGVNAGLVNPTITFDYTDTFATAAASELPCLQSGVILGCYEAAGTELKVPSVGNVTNAGTLPWTFGGNLPTTHNGRCSPGTEAWVINDGAGPTALTGFVVEWTYAIPTHTVTDVFVCDGYGGVLNDGDGLASYDITLFDAAGAVLAGPFNVVHPFPTGAPHITPIPGGPVFGVGRIRMSNMVTVAGSNGTGIREVGLMGPPLAPAVSQMDCDGGYSWIDARTGAAVATSSIVTCPEPIHNAGNL